MKLSFALLIKLINTQYSIAIANTNICNYLYISKKVFFHFMKLSANPIAKWFVQGSYYSAEVKGHSIIFKSDEYQEIIPFSLWDGQCKIERGIYWGKLDIYVITSSLSKDKKCISVFGLSWHELLSFAEHLSRLYHTWLKDHSKTISSIDKTINEIYVKLNNPNDYLRRDVLNTCIDQYTSLLRQNQLSTTFLEKINNKDAIALNAWLFDGENHRNLHNKQWKNKEIEKWSALFDSIESSPLNTSQRHAVILNDSHNLILAGAGSGKTSILIARAKYLVESKHAQQENILLLAFGKQASKEMKERLKLASLSEIEVATFHGIAKKIIQQTRNVRLSISPLAVDPKAREKWLTTLMKTFFVKEKTLKNWTKHLEKWSIPGIDPKKCISTQIEKPKFQRWLWYLISLINQQNTKHGIIRSEIKGNLQAESEFRLLFPIVDSYREELKTSNSQDFDGLIFEATAIIKKKNSAFKSPFRHIIVDEYQDISPSRLAFIQTLCNINGAQSRSLFAVGDDWQAIYRFAGADVRLTSDFLSRFPNGVVGNLDTTYRFNSQIGAVANRFIQVNPKQLPKSLNSIRQKEEASVHIIQSNMIENILSTKLSNMHTKKRVSVMLIGRMHMNKPKQLSVWEKKYPHLNFSFVTAHASKGLEADYVFILDVNKGIFPASDKNQGLSLVMLSIDEMLHAEERRLFYVAMTRARHACWICNDPNNMSEFVEELLENNYPITSYLPDRWIEHCVSETNEIRTTDNETTFKTIPLNRSK